MRRLLLSTALVLLGHAAAASDAPSLPAIAAAVDEAALHSTISSLVGFGTRHTLSDTHSETHGIGAARRWVAKRFSAISSDCGGCLAVVTPAQTVGGKRIVTPTEVVDVFAIQRGTGEPERVILVTGHLDSRVSDPMDASSDAPGANDDASGVAVVLEAARLLSKYHFKATLVYGVLSGEEQGLYGGKLLADRALSRLMRGDWPKTLEELEERMGSRRIDGPSKGPVNTPRRKRSPRRT